MIIKPKHVALILCDNRFIYEACDRELYLSKLFNFIHKKEEGKEIEIMTVSGRYGISKTLPLLIVDEKNKSGFANAVLDRLNYFNEIIFISNFNKEQYLYHLKTKLQEKEIPMTVFNYEVKTTQKPVYHDVNDEDD